MRFRGLWTSLMWAVLYGALAMLLAWARHATLAWLFAAAGVTLLSAVLYITAARRLAMRNSLLVSVLLLALGLVCAGAIAFRLHRIGTDWETLQSERAARTPHPTAPERTPVR